MPGPNSPKRAAQLMGQRFGRLVVTERLPNVRGCTRWRCVCDCGASTQTASAELLRGDAQSCGCLRRERNLAAVVTHGMSKTSTYNSWAMMHRRCSSERNKDFKHYGGRGIVICDRWKSFESFLADMGEKPEGFTIERINNDGNYEPSNCVWATRAAQGANTRQVYRMMIDGQQMTMRAACRKLGLKYNTVLMRIHRGADPTEALRK